MTKLIFFFCVVAFGVLLGMLVVYLDHHSQEDAEPLLTVFKREFQTRSPMYEGGITFFVGSFVGLSSYLFLGIVNQVTLFLYTGLASLILIPLLSSGFKSYVQHVKENRTGINQATVFFLVGSFLLTYGIIGSTNVFLDSAKPRKVKTVAADKYWIYLGGRRGLQYAYYLVVPVSTETNATVNYDLPVYRSESETAEPNETPVRFLLHPGYLGIPWVDTILVGPTDHYGSGLVEHYKNAGSH